LEDKQKLAYDCFCKTLAVSVKPLSLIRKIDVSELEKNTEINYFSLQSNIFCPF
jgi:hypothetical protein